MRSSRFRTSRAGIVTFSDPAWQTCVTNTLATRGSASEHQGRRSRLAQASKALDTRYFVTRDYIREKKLRVNFIRTHVNVSDFFTKALGQPVFTEFKDILMGTTSSAH